jgi:HSP20 family protein
MSVSTDLSHRDEGQNVAGAERTRTEPIFTPAVDIYETQDNLVLLADLPGVAKDDLNIKLDDELLTIEAEVHPSAAPGQHLVNEYAQGTFYRQFSVGEAIDRNKIDANLKNGVLELTLPKAEKAKPKRIQVKSD